MEEESFQDFFRQSTRQLEFVDPITKVHRLDEGYTFVPKMRDFAKNPKEEIWGKSKFLGLGGVLETFDHSTKLQEVRVLPTLVYIHL